jgi:hypothetical protein
MTKLILTDLDSTALDCSTPLHKFIEDNYGLFSSRHLRDHHNIPELFNISLGKTLEIIADFHRSTHMAEMEPLPCAATVLPALHKAGYKFIAITACLNEEVIVERRRRNLANAFGFEWDDVQCIGISNSKKEALQKYSSAIWVDDLFHHAADGADLGHTSFLLDKPYNQNEYHPKVQRVSDWHQIAERLL